MDKNHVFTYLALVACVYFAASLLWGAALGALAPSGADWLIAAAYPVPMLCALWFSSRWRGAQGVALPRYRMGLRAADVPVLGWGLLLAVACSVVIEPVLDLFPEAWFDWMNAQIGRGGWTLAATVVMAPLLEEMLFRGEVQRTVAASGGAWRGVLLSAALFGLVHLVPMQVISAFVIGVVLAYVYLRTGSLGAVIVLHAVNNAAAYALMPFDGSLREFIPSPGLYAAVYAVSLVIVALGVWGMARYFRKMDAGAQ